MGLEAWVLAGWKGFRLQGLEDNGLRLGNQLSSTLDALERSADLSVFLGDIYKHCFEISLFILDRFGVPIGRHLGIISDIFLGARK